MATTYEWNCKTVDCHPTEGGKTNVVYNVNWKLRAISDTIDPTGPSEFYESTYTGSQGIETSDLANFKDFEDLTNEDVVVWVKECIGTEGVTQIKALLDNQIDSQITPTTVTLVIGQPIPE